MFTPERLLASYDYRDEAGRLLYQVLRYEPKTFRQRRPDESGGWCYRLGDVRRVLYRLPELLAADREAPVFLVEGEKDAERLAGLGLVATTVAGGAGGWRPVYAESLRQRTVIILPDQDEPGRRFAEQAAASLRGVAQGVRLVNLPGLGAKGDVSDWLAEPGRHARALLEAVHAQLSEQDRAQPVATTSAVLPPRLLFRMLDQVEASRLAWLWPGYLPRGKLVLIEGDPGEGKSFLTLDLAARLSRGQPWPDGVGRPAPGNSLLIISEDGVEDIAKPRLEALGADASRIGTFDGFEEAGLPRTPLFPRDTPALAELVRRQAIELVILDPLAQFIDKGYTANNDQLIRQVLLPLARMAEETGCVLLIVRHLNKTPGGRAIYRGSGSIGIIGTSRCAYLVARDPQDPERRVLANVKMNIARQPPALGFRLHEDDHGQFRLSWDGVVELSADELVGSTGKKSVTAVNRASEFLTEVLTGGPQPREQVVEQASKQGISDATLRRAREALGVVCKRQPGPGPGDLVLGLADTGQRRRAGARPPGRPATSTCSTRRAAVRLAASCLFPQSFMSIMTCISDPSERVNLLKSRDLSKLPPGESPCLIVPARLITHTVPSSPSTPSRLGSSTTTWATSSSTWRGTPTRATRSATCARPAGTWSAPSNAGRARSWQRLGQHIPLSQITRPRRSESGCSDKPTPLKGMYHVTSELAIRAASRAFQSVPDSARVSLGLEPLEDRTTPSIFFTTSDANGDRLWKTDGTPNTTVRVTGITATSPFTAPGNLTVVGQQLFFTATNASGGQELWRSDGTEAGTRRVKDIRPGAMGSSPANLTGMNGVCYFTADNGTHGSELWRSDGSDAGTYMVRDITIFGGSVPRNLTVAGSQLFFSAATNVGRELWVSDGSNAGTRLVGDLVDGDADPRDITGVNNRVYFTAWSSDNTRQLYKSDGTWPGTVQITTSTVPLSSIGNLARSGDDLFFTADEGAGVELYVSEGMTNGRSGRTYMVRDIHELGSASPQQLTDVAGTLFFTADRQLRGRQLWSTQWELDAHTQTMRYGAYRRTTDFTFATTNPPNMVNVAGTLYFVAADAVGVKLWKYTTGQMQPQQVHAFGTSFGTAPKNLTADGARLYFTVSAAPNNQIWKSDSTGTSVITAAPNLGNLTRFFFWPIRPIGGPLDEPIVAPRPLGGF